MKERAHCTPGGCPGATAPGEIVQVYVAHHHPLLQLKRALPWEVLCEVMTETDFSPPQASGIDPQRLGAFPGFSRPSKRRSL